MSKCVPSVSCVVTTINKPTRAIKVLSRLLEKDALIVVGDLKTPSDWHSKNVQFLAHSKPLKDFTYSKHAPSNHYARKNLGYLQAIAAGSDVIYDTDDDNIPNNTWRVRTESIEPEVVLKKGWCNIYSYVTQSNAWPRGFSLAHLDSSKVEFANQSHSPCYSPIQQGLSDESPDVDAIWRMATPKPFLTFSRKVSIFLGKGVWCPFNSQSTWWWPEAYPLMYLPANAPFRMTDIWRSFVAQRCLWKSGFGVTFHSPAEVIQKRNKHNLYSDFKDEIKGYTHNGKIADALESLKLTQSVTTNLRLCYEALVALNVLPESELMSVDAWIKDVLRLQPIV